MNEALPGVNWRRLIVDLERNGYTHPSIGFVIEVSKATIESWKNRDIEPSHRKGERLILLWCAVMDRKREELPRREAETMSAAAFK